MPQVTLRISDELEARLQKLADSKEISRAAAMRLVLSVGTGSTPTRAAVAEAIALLSAQKKVLFGSFGAAFSRALAEALTTAFGADARPELDLDDYRDGGTDGLEG